MNRREWAIDGLVLAGGGLLGLGVWLAAGWPGTLALVGGGLALVGLLLALTQPGGRAR